MFKFVVPVVIIVVYIFQMKDEAEWCGVRQMLGI